MSLDRLLGTWTFTMRHVAVAEPVVGEQRYERVLDGAFVMMRSSNPHPDFPDAIALLDLTTYSYFDVRGFTRTFELTLDDDAWSIVRRDPDFWQRSTTTFRGPDVMEGRGENSHDGGVTWEHDFDMSYVRVR